MDETDPNIVFYADGTCSHCRHASRYVATNGDGRHPIDKIADLIRQISSSRHSKYDCIVGLSGGVDSSWLLHLMVSAGLRVYVHHVDTGWNTNKAVANIYRICDVLGQRLNTHVVDWNLFRKVQQAYFYSGVINQDVPQDIAIFSSQIAASLEHHIGCLASGANNTTESILPSAWGHHWHDVSNLQKIYSMFWNRPLHHFPYATFNNLAAYRLGYIDVLDIRTINVLDLIRYSKRDALHELKRLYNYEPYSHKHGESAWTLYYQAIYLPSVFKIDKRKAHLSNLIVNRDLSREDAINILSQPSIDQYTAFELANLVSLKLGIPLQHALRPGDYVRPTLHAQFSPSKNIIDTYTAKFFSAPCQERHHIYSRYISHYGKFLQ